VLRHTFCFNKKHRYVRFKKRISWGQLSINILCKNFNKFYNELRMLHSQIFRRQKFLNFINSLGKKTEVTSFLMDVFSVVCKISTYRRLTVNKCTRTVLAPRKISVIFWQNLLKFVKIWQNLSKCAKFPEFAENLCAHNLRKNVHVHKVKNVFPVMLILMYVSATFIKNKQENDVNR